MIVQCMPGLELSWGKYIDIVLPLSVGCIPSAPYDCTDICMSIDLQKSPGFYTIYIHSFVPNTVQAEVKENTVRAQSQVWMECIRDEIDES